MEVESAGREGHRIMSIKEVSAEQLARLFHLYHEALAGDFSGLRNDSHPAWNEIPEPERKRMIAALRLALLDLGFAERTFTAKDQETARPHFAEPGAAEWGC
jgi:hypothetical protein